MKKTTKPAKKPSEEQKSQELEQDRLESEIRDEYQYAKGNIISVIETSKEVMANTADLALESDHPRMIEVYTTLINSMTSINRSLFELRENYMSLSGKSTNTAGDDEDKKQVNNAVFVGSSEDVMKFLKKDEE